MLLRAAEQAKRIEEFGKKISPYEAAEAALIDDIIDPADTRHFLGQTLKAMPTPATRNHRKRVIDAW